MRPPTPASSKARAWKSFARYIRSRDKQCITCGKPTTEAGHFFHTTDKAGTKTLGGNEVWFDERNVNGQCAYCNRWRSGKQAEYAIYLEDEYDYGIIQELRDLNNTPRKWTIEELLNIEKKYDELTKYRKKI